MIEHPATILGGAAALLGAVALLVLAVVRLIDAMRARTSAPGNGGRALTLPELRIELAALRVDQRADLVALEARLDVTADARTQRAAARVGAHVDDALAEVVEARTPPGRRP